MFCFFFFNDTATTEIYTLSLHDALPIYPEFLNSSVRKQIFHKDQNPFLHEMFKRVGSQKERMEIVEDKGPCVIMATSGMLVGGPSVEYLKHLAEIGRAHV